MSVETQLTAKKRTWPAFTPVVIATVAIFIISAIFVPQTMAPISIGAMLPFAAVLAIAAVGQTLVIQQRGIDLSVGGVISLAAMGIGVTTTRWGMDFTTGLILTVIACGVFGLINAILVAILNITPLVATLASNALLTGTIAMVTGSAPATAPSELTGFAMFTLFGQPLLLWIAIVFVAVMALVTVKTVEGRRFVASGANPSAANISGIRVNRSLFMAYITASLSYALAGLLLAGYLKNTTIGVGAPYMLSVIAVVIVGGTPLVGGRGTIIGSAIAALFLSQLVQMLLTMGAPTSVQMLLEALAIAAAATLQGMVGRTRRAKVKPQPVLTQAITTPPDKQPVP